MLPNIGSLALASTIFNTDGEIPLPSEPMTMAQPFVKSVMYSELSVFSVAAIIFMSEAWK